MSQPTTTSMLTRAVAIATLAIATAGIALGDDNPPANPAPGGRHNNPAWAACKKQADDQKLDPGDARRQFMKTCLKSAKDSAPAPSAS